MKKFIKQKKISVAVSAALVGVFTTAYLANSVSSVENGGKEKSENWGLSVMTAVPGNENNGNYGTVKGSSYSGKLIDTAKLFNAEDINQTVSLSNASVVSVTDNKNVNIKEEGTYIIRGNSKQSSIIIEASENSKVTLVLDGVNITNRNFPIVYVKSAGKVIINTSKNSSNKLNITEKFLTDGNNKIDSVIFSNSDLTLNGTGKLDITSKEGNAVTSTDNLVITGGTYTVNSEKHAFEGFNSVSINNGNFTVSTKKDGFHSENSDDDKKGHIYISGGTFKINAEDDGIQATTFAIIDGGTFDIDAAEGIEATYVQINNGNISIKASDDGINAAEKTTAYKINLEVNGGNIDIVMAEGDTDAFDSNGDFTINNGTLNITARSPFDYDGTGRLNGGNITVNGSKVTELTNQFFGRPGGRGTGRGGRRP